MASIGAVSCSYVQGSSRGLMQRLLTWFVPGTNGTFGMKLGINDSAFSFRVIKYDTHANALSWKTALEATVGTVVTITDDQTQAWTNCLVKSIGGGDGRWRTPALNSGVAGVTTRGELTVSGVVVS